MTRGSNKDYNAMLNDSKDMPKIIEMTNEKWLKRWGGKRLIIAPPIDFDKYMKLVPKGRVITVVEIQKKLISDYHAEAMCPMTSGIFIQIAAWASYQRKVNPTPYWHTLKTDGELNDKYPGDIENQ